MNKILVGLTSFAAGGTVGVLLTRRYFRRYYERAFNEHLEAVETYYQRKEAPEKAPAEADPAPVGKPVLLRESVDPTQRERFASEVRRNGYAAADKPAEEGPIDEDPYVIMPEEFDTLENYVTVSLTWFSDHVLADENDRAMTDSEIEVAVGHDSLTHFGEYEPDSVFVRNDRFKIDYEILLDPRTYEETVRKNT